MKAGLTTLGKPAAEAADGSGGGGDDRELWAHEVGNDADAVRRSEARVLGSPRDTHPHWLSWTWGAGRVMIYSYFSSGSRVAKSYIIYIIYIYIYVDIYYIIYVF